MFFLNLHFDFIRQGLNLQAELLLQLFAFSFTVWLKHTPDKVSLLSVLLLIIPLFLLSQQVAQEANSYKVTLNLKPDQLD